MDPVPENKYKNRLNGISSNSTPQLIQQEKIC